MADFLQDLGSRLVRAGAAGSDPAGFQRMQDERQQKQQAARMAALEKALEIYPAGDPRRDPIEAELTQMLGGGQAAANAVIGIRPQAQGADIRNVGGSLAITRPGEDPEFFTPPGAAPGEAESTAALRTRQRKIDDQMRLNNLTRAQATDVVDGNKRVSRPDKFGNIYLVNTATGDAEIVSGKGAGGPTITAPPAEEVQATAAPPDLEEAAQLGTGPGANVRQGFANLFGFMVSGQVAPKTTQARQTLRFFERDAKRSLVLNRRFPVAEMAVVNQLLPDPDVFFKDPDDAVEQIRTFRTWLKAQEQTKEQELGAPALTSARKAELSDQLSGIRETLALMPGEPGQMGRFGEMSYDQLMEVDSTSLSPEDGQLYLEALKAK